MHSGVQMMEYCARKFVYYCNVVPKTQYYNTAVTKDETVLPFPTMGPLA